MDKNKKILIGAIIITIIVISLVAIITFITKSQKREESKTKVLTTLDISQVFEIENIEKSKYEIEKIDNIQIAPKYLSGTNSYELKANVKFMETTGKMVYIREEYSNLNIYQTEYKIDQYESINSQVEGIIEEFERMCKNYFGIDQDEKAKNEELYGESSSKNEIPLGENIYYKNRLYSKTYELNEKEYDINFYRNGEKIICEFVRQIVNS